MSDSITYPERRTAPLRTNPQSLLLYGGWKIGKTTAVAQLPDTLILELQPGGADFVGNCWAMEITKKELLVQVLDDLAKKRATGKSAAKRIAVDYLGILDEWLFEFALEAFFDTPRGRPYKAGEKAIKEIIDLPGERGSPGWAWYREQLSIIHHKMLMAADEIIYIGHTREARNTKESGEVASIDIDVTGGKGRRLFCGQSSAIGFMFRRRQIVEGAEEDQLVITFKTSETTVCGSAPPHLSGKEFVVGRSRNGQPPVFDWKEIYPV